MNILITICARGGSKGVKGKNIKILAGHPLLYYTVRQAIDWGKASHIVTSTDSDEIASIAKESGSEVPFKRPSNLATDTCGTLPVLQHALNKCERIYKTRFDLVIDLPVTAPIRKTDDLDKALKLFLDKSPKTLLSVVPASRSPYFNMLEENKQGRMQLSKQSVGIIRRQDAPQVYDMNNSIYIYRSDFLKKQKNPPRISDDTIAYIMDPITAIDIDTELDFLILETLVSKKIVNL